MGAAPDMTTQAVGSAVTGGLDPYGQLIKMLIPRARNIAIYGLSGRVLWVANGQDDPDLHSMAVEALGAAPASPFEIDGFAKRVEGTINYAFRLRDASGRAISVATMILPESGEQRPFSLVLSLVRPALECLAREINMRVSLGALNRDLSNRDQDLELLLDVAREERGAARDADELGRLAQAATEHLECVAGALIIPERGIAIVRRNAALRCPGDTELVSRTHRHLMTWAQMQRRTLLVNGVSGSSRLPPCKIISVPVRHSSGRVMGFLALFRGVEAKDFERRHTRLGELLSRKVGTILQTSFDAMTGLSTRAAFELEVGAVLSDDAVTGEHAVIYVDLDQMHLINENFSMPVGDEIIIKAAELLRHRAPRSAIVARISGDRFALFLKSCDLNVAAEVGETLRAAVAELTHQVGQQMMTVSLSAGVAQVDQTSKQPLAHALAAAEIACKAAKDRGRDRVERYESGDESIMRRHDDAHIIGELRNWLAKDQFVLYAQMIQPLGNTAGEPRYEILLRRETESGEILPPGKFMSAAERYQMMPAIDAWVIENTFAALAPYSDMLTDRLVRFSINLSAQSLADDALIATVDKASAAARISPDLVCFELTESVAVGNLPRTEQIMQELRLMGFQFALDDFGAGQSSLAYLKTLPVSILKIDGTFVRDSMSNARSADMVKAIAQLARTLGMTTIAEYVETDELRIQMANLGVDYGQGFAIGRPMPLAQVLNDIGLSAELDAQNDAPARVADEVGASGRLPRDESDDAAAFEVVIAGEFADPTPDESMRNDSGEQSV
jgi:diguanylate cyclase (GGDEF)-like protein